MEYSSILVFFRKCNIVLNKVICNFYTRAKLCIYLLISQKSFQYLIQYHLELLIPSFYSPFSERPNNVYTALVVFPYACNQISNLLTGIVIHLAPPPPRASSEPSMVTTHLLYPSG